MEQPSLDVLLKYVDSKYTLVVAAAKRARLITESELTMAEPSGVKAVSAALQEIADNKVKYERTKIGIK